MNRDDRTLHPFRSSLKGLWRWRYSGLAVALVLPPCIAMMLLLPPLAPRPLGVEPASLPKAELEAARKEAVERSTHFEQLMVAIGSFELGIVAYVAGVVLGKDARIQNPNLFFGLFTCLTFVTTVAYLHTFRIYCAYSLYIAQLEMGLRPGLRTMSEVFQLAMTPHAPRILHAATALAGSLEVIALYPVFILCAAIMAFARRLRVELDIVCAVVVVAGGWSFLYAFPAMIEFVNSTRIAAPR